MPKVYCSECGLDLKRYRKEGTVCKCRVCQLRSWSSKFKESEVDDAFGNWLMGFVDGEGNFQYREDRKDVVFRINLREDDKAILEEIRNRLGVGRLHYRDLSDKSNRAEKYRNGKDRNQWEFKVSALVDLVEVVIPVFDKYGLRAKKRNQYLTWREEVLNRWKIANDYVEDLKKRERYA